MRQETDLIINVDNVIAALNEKFGVTDITGSTYIEDFDGKGSRARLGNTVSVGYTDDNRVFKSLTTYFKYDYTNKKFIRCQ